MSYLISATTKELREIFNINDCIISEEEQEEEWLKKEMEKSSVKKRRKQNLQC